MIVRQCDVEKLKAKRSVISSLMLEIVSLKRARKEIRKLSTNNGKLLNKLGFSAAETRCQKEYRRGYDNGVKAVQAILCGMI